MNNHNISKKDSLRKSKKYANNKVPISELKKHKYGKLRILSDAPPYVHKNKNYRRVNAVCDCGIEITTRLSLIKSGKTQSCGCLVYETMKTLHLKHGMSSKGNRLYKTWNNMKTRCYNTNNDHFESYGGRGICVCDEWRYDFKSFCKWAMDNNYSKDKFIDRINVDGNYEPSNVRFVSSDVSAHNVRLLSKANKSGYRGVNFAPHIKKYISRIGHNGKRTHLGVFDSPVDAAKAYDKAAIKLDDGRPLNFT